MKEVCTMSCFFSMPFSNNPYITPWGTIGPDGTLPGQPGDSCRHNRNYRQCVGVSYPYHVQPGDTLNLIARRLEASFSAIIAANPGIDPSNPGIGQMICIPACPPGHSVRYIQPGDTLDYIAREFDTSAESILESNPGSDPYYLRIGQRLFIPRHSLPGIY